MTYILHSSPAAFGVRNASPFSLKAESLLCLAGVDYERVNAQPIKGPRQKLPWLVTPEGETISDSRNILLHLQREEGLDLPAAEHDVAIRRVAEEHLYFAAGYFRWKYHPDAVKQAFFASIPSPFRGLVFGMVRRSVMKQFHAQGIGRRPEAEILDLAIEDLSALDGLLGEGPYYGGEDLSLADVVVHASCSQLDSDLVHPLTKLYRTFPRLVAHQARVERRICPRSLRLPATSSPRRMEHAAAGRSHG